MNTRLISLLLALAAGVICLGNFYYKYTRLGVTDYTILAAGLLLFAIGIMSYGQKPKR